MKIAAIAFALLATVISNIGLATDDYAGGSGTAEDPYQIAEPNQLQALGANFLDWNKHFVLTADIDLAYFDGQDGRPVFNRIGIDQDHPFNGTFDGQGHAIVRK